MRGKPAVKRKIAPDEIYKNQLVSKFINYVMEDGKKAVARKIVYQVIEDLSVKTKIHGIDALEKAIENVRPKVEVRSRRVGGANFQVPVPVSAERQNFLAFKWIIEAARSGRKNIQIWESLSREIMNAFKKEGVAIKKKEEVTRMAEANKAFAQFA